MLTAFLAFAPAWHHLQSTGVRISLISADGLQQSPPSAVTVGTKQIEPQPSKSDGLKRTTDQPSKPRQRIKHQSPKAASKTLTAAPQTRQALTSFQMTSQLQTARLDAELANELDYQTINSLADSKSSVPPDE
jgi:hypothetical protein